jgi:hypothetical protein
LALLSLGVGVLAFGNEPPAGQVAQETPRGSPDDSERINPVRRLEAEIEEYPAPQESPASDTATRIPEAVEEPVRPATSSAPDIDRSEVQPVLGRDIASVPLAELDTAQVTLLQQRLRERGLYLGRIDGIAGPQTRAAVQAHVQEQFALARRLLEQGQMTSDLAELVGVSPSTHRPAP